MVKCISSKNMCCLSLLVSLCMMFFCSVQFLSSIFSLVFAATAGINEFTVSIWLDSIFLVSGMINFTIWLLFYIYISYKCKFTSDKQDITLTRVKHENRTFQRQLTEINIEIAFRQRELNNIRNHRRSARIEDSPLHTDLVNERDHLLPVSRSPDYQDLQFYNYPALS